MGSRPTGTMISIVAFTLAIVTTVFVFSLPAMAQATTGTLKGTVVDPNGQVIAGATVTARNEGTRIEVSSTANSEGSFVFATLPPGKYTVSVAPSSGFKSHAVTGVDVRLGTETDIKIELEIGTPTETVTVTGNTSEIVQTTSQLSTSFETRKVEELPSNSAGGGIDTLALLAPGVVPGFGNVNQNGVTLSVNGNRARSNNFTLDGTDNNDLSIGGPNFFVDNQDAVAEFQIITNNFSAQYGRNQGAVVNIVTKAGTNEFHGSLFEFHRNSSSLDAMTNLQRRNPARSRRDKFVSNVFGGTIGGPIYLPRFGEGGDAIWSGKNKAFFFFDLQLIRQRQQFNFQSTNSAITPAGLQTLANEFPGNPAIQSLVNQSVFAINPLARARADRAGGTLCFPRDPLAACTGANAVIVPTAIPEFPHPLPFDETAYGIRGDFNATSRDTFNVKYRYQNSPETGFLTGANGFFGDIPFTSRNLNGAYTRQFGSRVVNEFKAATQKLSVIFGGSSGSCDPLRGCIPHATELGSAFTNITYTGIASAGATLQAIGPATNLPQGREVEVTQFADTMVATVGNHTLTFGADIRFLTNSVPFLPNLNGAFRFSSTARLVANAPDFLTLAAGEPTISYKERDQFYFFQDDWKVRDNLTLNLGIRYEYVGQPINTLHDLSVAAESNPSTALWRQNLPIEARTQPKLPADKNNFAPRLGFAWSPRFGNSGFARFLVGENDATVVRGGYSIAYDPAFYNIMLNISTSAPSVFLDTIRNPASLAAARVFSMPPNPTGDVVRESLASFLRRDTFDPRFLAQTQVSPDFHSPMSQQWSFSIQRQVNRNNVAEVRYVGNRGSGLFQTVNRNPFIGNLLNGFSRVLCLTRDATGACTSTQTFNFPAFANTIPSGITMVPISGDNPATPDNEAADDGRIIAGRGLIRSRENTAFSSYHGLQARYNGRLANQLTLGASYTWSKTIDNASEIFAFGENAIAANAFDLENNERGLSGNDRRHATAINFIWDVPAFRDQRGFAGHALGGWQFNGVFTLASGRTYTPSQFVNVFGFATYQDFPFTATFFGFDNVRPFSSNPNAPRTSVAISDVDTTYFGFRSIFVPSPTGYYSLNSLNTSGAFVPVAPSDVRYIINGPETARRFGNPFGNVGRNIERGPRLNHLNFGIFKNTKVSETVNIQFRAELFNALNHPNAGYGVAAGATLPDFFLENAGRTFNDFGEIGLSSRRVQFGLRIIF